MCVPTVKIQFIKHLLQDGLIKCNQKHHNKKFRPHKCVLLNLAKNVTIYRDNYFYNRGFYSM